MVRNPDHDPVGPTPIDTIEDTLRHLPETIVGGTLGIRWRVAVLYVVVLVTMLLGYPFVAIGAGALILLALGEGRLA